MKEDLLYELTIEDENDFIYAISMVTEPAIESNWIYFGKEKVQLAKLDDEKRLVLGAILIPNKNILRLDGEGNPYHVFIKPETIKRLSEIYLEKKYTDAVTIEHQRPVDDITLVESWIVSDTKRDKSAVYGLSLPVGTWAGTMHVKNELVWNEYVKTGILSGFSIEGIFSHQLVKNSKEPAYLRKQISDLDEQEALLVLSKIEALFESYSDYGEGIRNNAKRGIDLNEKNGNKCATQVGKVRSAQLEAGEPISIDTLKRMYSYLSRAEVYYDETDMNACGTISFLLWGGKAGLSYSRNKLKELGLLEEGEVGVPHYTKDGKLYEGPTHKDSEGRLMTGEVHTEDSEYLYHKEDLEAQPSINSTYPGQAASGSIAPQTLAEVGPKGGIRESDKAPKSGTPNKDPKGEGTAKGDASGKSAKVTVEQEKTLQGKVDEFNEKESNTKNGRATLGQLKSVFQRGLGAFNTSHSPLVKSASQWAFARVNAYLYLLKNGRPENPKYDTDFDLLPKGHPKAK